MARISRKELKKDEFRESLKHGAESVSAHRRGLGEIAVVLLLVVLAVLGWRYYTQRQAAQASTALADAMKIYNARIRTAGEPPQPGETLTYVDEKNKYEDASAKLSVVADKYPRTRAGQEARYFDALCHLHNSQNDQAEKEFTTVANSGNDDLASLANYQLAALYAKTGKTSQAIQLYQQLMAKPTVLMPKPEVMLTLADMYSQSNPAESIKLLNQIKQDFPDSPAADEATKRLGQPAGQS